MLLSKGKMEISFCSYLSLIMPSIFYEGDLCGIDAPLLKDQKQSCPLMLVHSHHLDDESGQASMDKTVFDL